jgi:uncharacterized protein (DUF302 family)
MKIIFRIFFTLLIGCCLLADASADEMIIVRSDRDFAETMNALQNAIVQHGYKVSKVQRVDVGLEAKGYKTDKYRVVFYGKADEIASLAKNYPQLIPFLPLSVAIFAEGEQTMLATIRPRSFKALFPDTSLQTTFSLWDSDLVNILGDVRKSH